MKTIIFLLVSILTTNGGFAQNQEASKDSIPIFFNEIKVAAKKNTSLWNNNLYGAILLVDPQTRQVFSNEPDTAGILKPEGDIYSGILPDNIIIANTAINWNGKRWAMIMLPLPQNKQARISLLAHESFHRVQPMLGFAIRDIVNNHLDDKDGRIYLRLELEALKKAIQASSKRELQQCLTDAMTFRKYRNMLYPDTDTTENLLELNEGIAEFTGLIIGGRSKKQMTDYFVNGINNFYTNPTFVRSFAYFTTPVYGYLLYGKNKNWNISITDSTNLTDCFIRAFHIDLPIDLKKSVDINSGNYNGKIIVQEEATREEKIKKLVAEYKYKFIESPHFELQFEKMNISFDPRNIMPIEDKGTVYPNIKVIDLWGILTIDNGALLSPDWDKISISNPVETEGKKVIGDGWTLELTDGYIIEKEMQTGNYKLNKK
ncbi:MAG: hypothetical protein LBV74_02720 [Tannerella sp.]|jgi:hypothetical protein|nr:hypothetical protein [Tannerella sp.]